MRQKPAKWYSRHLWGWPLQAILAVSAVGLLATGEMYLAGVATLAFVLSFLSLVLEGVAQVKLPWFIHLSYVVFVFGSVFAGEVLGMYGRIWNWDDGLHLASGLLVGLVGVLGLLSLMRGWNHQLPAWFQVLVVSLLAAAVAVLWEIVEFIADQNFGVNMQRGSLEDTMQDLIHGTLGGLLVAGLYLIDLKIAPVLGLNSLIRHYKKLNNIQD